MDPSLPPKSLSNLPANSRRRSRSSTSPSRPKKLPTLPLIDDPSPTSVTRAGTRRASAESSSSLPKVCITAGGIVGDGVGHHLYIVDLNSEYAHYSLYKAGEIGDDSSAICVVGSSVYMFEAEDLDKFDKDRKRVYSYSLSSSNSDDIWSLDVEKPKQLCMMEGTKFCPHAVVAPGGTKILVYASAIRPFFPGNRERCDFELFDVKHNICNRLPQLRPWGSLERETTTASVRSAFFRSASALMVLVGTRVYSLKLDGEGSAWEPSFNVLYNWVPMGTPFEMLGENTYLTPSEAYDVRHPDRSFIYPGLSESGSGPSYPMLLDSRDPDHVDFCIVHAEVEEVDDFSSIPHYIIDVYRCDLRELEEMEEEKQLPGTTKSKSLRFSLAKDDTFLLRNCCFHLIQPNNA